MKEMVNANSEPLGSKEYPDFWSVENVSKTLFFTVV
jgi:hypothetical protein